MQSVVSIASSDELGYDASNRVVESAHLIHLCPPVQAWEECVYDLVRILRCPVVGLSWIGCKLVKLCEGLEYDQGLLKSIALLIVYPVDHGIWCLHILVG